MHLPEYLLATAPFHGRKAVAPLKHAYPLAAGALGGPFHGRKAVAPLKLHLCDDHYRAVRDLPRPQGRGPIEALDVDARLLRLLLPSTAARPWPH